MSRIDRILGIGAISRTSALVTSHRLRVVAYHDVPAPATFATHLDLLVDRYTVVSGEQVVAALHRGHRLPRGALWITFDDGRRSVVDNGLPVLVERGISATAFVCPGLVESGDPYWWSTVESAVQRGPVEFDGRIWRDRRLVTHLKGVDDDERRAFVESLPPTLTEADPSLDLDALRRWADSGMEVGNHTWDHPCLPRCTTDVQRTQILDAQRWLEDHLGTPCHTFAYPNGDADRSARDILATLDDIVAVAFDHRLNRVTPDTLAVSRLRLDTDAREDRVRAVLGGAHSGLFRLRSDLRARRDR